MTEEMNEAPFKAVDMSQFKRTYLDIPYADAHEREKLDLVLPDEGEGPLPRARCRARRRMEVPLQARGQHRGAFPGGLAGLCGRKRRVSFELACEVVCPGQ